MPAGHAEGAAEGGAHRVASGACACACACNNRRAIAAAAAARMESYGYLFDGHSGVPPFLSYLELDRYQRAALHQRHLNLPAALQCAPPSSLPQAQRSCRPPEAVPLIHAPQEQSVALAGTTVQPRAFTFAEHGRASQIEHRRGREGARGKQKAARIDHTTSHEPSLLPYAQLVTIEPLQSPFSP